MTRTTKLLLGISAIFILAEIIHQVRDMFSFKDDAFDFKVDDEQDWRGI